MIRRHTNRRGRKSGQTTAVDTSPVTLNVLDHGVGQGLGTARSATQVRHVTSKPAQLFQVRIAICYSKESVCERLIMERGDMKKWKERRLATEIEASNGGVLRLFSNTQQRKATPNTTVLSTTNNT